MSTENGKNVSQVSERLKEERRRLGFTQEAVCVFLGIKTPKTLRAWESGISAPDAFDLETMFANGFDVSYVVTGVRRPMLATDAAKVVYQTPAQSVGAAVSGLTLDLDDSELLLAMARRLAGEKK